MMLGSIGSLARLLVGIEAWGLEIIGARSHTISIYHVVAAAICLELCNYAACCLAAIYYHHNRDYGSALFFHRLPTKV